MNTIKIVTVVGARPQFIKAAAVSRAVSVFNEKTVVLKIDEKIVHTGQHYDENMSKTFFDELQIPRPFANLEVGSGHHGQQTGKILERLEKTLLDEKPDWVLIYGDTNSTLAGALAAAKLHIPVAHVEAGLRSYNRDMPEEINRVVADCLSTILFCPTDAAVENLAKEGITQGIWKVGDVMYDSILYNTGLAERDSDILSRMNLTSKSYYLATIHRAENTDDTSRLNSIMFAIKEMAKPVILPLHPRARKILGAGLSDIAGQVRVIEPVSYLDMLMLEKNARIILTDSGGVQKEAYWFHVPCITLRNETEWVELVAGGYNQLSGAETHAIFSAVEKAESSLNIFNNKKPKNLYGDGHSAEKIITILAGSFKKQKSSLEK